MSAGQRPLIISISTLFLLLHCCNARFLLVQTEDKNEINVTEDLQDHGLERPDHDQEGEDEEMEEESDEDRVDELPEDLQLLTDSLETENGRGNSDYYYCENNFCT